MVGVTKQTNLSQTVCVDRMGEQEEEQEELTLPSGEFSWNTGQQQMLLGSYYWGYTLAQVPSAWVATKIGFRLAFGLAMMAGSLLTLLFPLAVHTSVWLGVVARICLGLVHAVAASLCLHERYSNRLELLCWPRPQAGHKVETLTG